MISQLPHFSFSPKDVLLNRECIRPPLAGSILDNLLLTAIIKCKWIILNLHRILTITSRGLNSRTVSSEPWNRVQSLGSANILRVKKTKQKAKQTHTYTIHKTNLTKADWRRKEKPPFPQAYSETKHHCQVSSTPFSPAQPPLWPCKSLVMGKKPFCEFFNVCKTWQREGRGGGDQTCAPKPKWRSDWVINIMSDICRGGKVHAVF